MRALFVSKNLLGDGLNIYPALSTWCKDNPDWEVHLVADPGSEIIYERMMVPNVKVINEISEVDGCYDIEFKFDCGEAFRYSDQHKVHIAQAYADLLGVTLAKGESEGSLKFEVDETQGDTGEGWMSDLILVSPFSRSCASQSGQPPNKMLPWPKLKPIINQLRKRGNIGILGSNGDRLPHDFEIAEHEYFTGLSLNTVALMLRDCKYLFTIDNGISHLAATQQTKSVVLYPACLGLHWIAPLNKNAHVIHMNPVTVPVPELIWQINSILDEFEKESL